MKTEDVDPQDVTVDQTVQLNTRVLPAREATETGKTTVGKHTATLTMLEKTGDITRSIFRKKISVHEVVVEEHFGENAKQREVQLTTVPEEFLYNLEQSFQPRKEIARGGHGKISLYEDQALERNVAVKSLLGELEQDAELRSRFVAEAKVTSQLDHPSIPPVHGLLGDPAHRLHMVMKMIDGMTLTNYLERVRKNYIQNGVSKFDVRKDLFERLNIFRRVCHAVEYANSHQVAHCDLKPDNIMIGRYNETYVMDWGIAKTREAMLKKQTSRRLTGTPRYLSPEAVVGDETWKDEPDTRKYGWMSSDLYALGLILFELTMLSPAYEGKNSDEVIHRVADGDMEPLVNRFGCRVDNDLQAIIKKATAQDLRERYHSVRAMDEDIAKYLRGEEVSARPDNRFRKVIRWGGRHALLLLFTALIALLIASSSATYTVYNHLEAARLDKLVTLAASRAIRTGEELDTRFDKLNTGLWALAMEARSLLTEQHGGGHTSGDICIREIGPGAAPYRIAAPDFDCIYYLRAPGLSMADADTVLRKLEVMEESFLRFILESDDLGAGGEATELKLKLADSQLPASRLFVGLRNGLHIVYPRNLDYPENYDPRKRDWYQAHSAGKVPPGTPYWLSYRDVSNGRRLLAGRIVIQDDNGEKLGVMAFDLPLEQLYRIIRERTPEGARPGILINSEGRIMPEDGGEPGEVHPAFQEIQKREFGRGTGTDGELYLFSRLKAPGWFYVEKFIR